MEELKSEEKETTAKEKNIVMAALCYFGILVLIPLLTDSKKRPVC